MTSLAKTAPTATCWTLHDPNPMGFVLAAAAFNIYCFLPREWGPRTLTVVVDTRGDIGFYAGRAAIEETDTDRIMDMAAEKSLRRHVADYELPVPAHSVPKNRSVALQPVTANVALAYSCRVQCAEVNPDYVAMGCLRALIHMPYRDRSHLVCHLVGKKILDVADMAAKVEDIYPAAKPGWQARNLVRNARMVRTRLRGH